MHMIRHKMTLFNPAFLLQRQPAKYLAEMLPQLCIQCFSPTLGNEYDVVYAEFRNMQSGGPACPKIQHVGADLHHIIRRAST
jgi:hypothetical protein